jgi:hypothetical protein
MALRRHWRSHPRPEWLIAGYLGFKPQPEAITTIARPRRPAPPTGALLTLFASLGGKAGQTIVVNT